MGRRSVLAVLAGAAVTAAAGAVVLLAPCRSGRRIRLLRRPADPAARWVAANPNDSRMPVIRGPHRQRAAGPVADAAHTGTVASEVSALTTAAAAAGKVPIIVVSHIPNRDCGGASGGGMPDHPSYRAWIDQVANGLGGRPATIVLEPDVLPIMTNCQSSAQPPIRGPRWPTPGSGSSRARARPSVLRHWTLGLAGPVRAAARLVAADIANSADGISLNVSNYRSTSSEVAYAKSIIAATGISRLQAVSDTSRNGNGPLGSEWCDPAGRAIGTPSTTETGDAKIDAFLWVKLPGEADGCIAAAGQFVAQRAYDLAIAAPTTSAPPCTTAPPAPTNLSAMATSGTSVTLQWTPVVPGAAARWPATHLRAPGASGGTFTQIAQTNVTNTFSDNT